MGRTGGRPAGEYRRVHGGAGAGGRWDGHRLSRAFARWTGSGREGGAPGARGRSPLSGAVPCGGRSRAECGRLPYGPRGGRGPGGSGALAGHGVFPGPTLAALLEAEGPMDEARLRQLGAALAEALAAIHGCGLVHRDLKPGNIIMASDGPRVLDFGISRACSRRPPQRTRPRWWYLRCLPTHRPVPSRRTRPRPSLLLWVRRRPTPAPHSWRPARLAPS
ncbi:hypothetical protein [Streptomyces sp. TLI_146]|uniref:protein kinase domain-containing protein n=1 Tax=Streptomyces sp. TLI_146 TaxID=1938858 RepID=UPI0027D89322|nr:hypothetical protein [Streptomyces sp. TLI_146]